MVVAAAVLQSVARFPSVLRIMVVVVVVVVEPPRMVLEVVMNEVAQVDIEPADDIGKRHAAAQAAV